MSFSVHLGADLQERLDRLARATGRKRNALIREAVEELLRARERSVWSERILHHTGFLDAPRIEEDRGDVLEPRDPFDAPPP